MKPLHQELSEIATTPQLERIAHELKLTQRHLKRNLEVLANFESKEYKYLILLECVDKKKIPKKLVFTASDYVIKSQTIDEIIKLIEKLQIMEHLRIQLVNGRWTVNGRFYKEMSFLERDLLDKAINGLSKEIEFYKSLEDHNYNKSLNSLNVNGYEIVTPEKL